MAIYHCSLRVFTRSQGHSAVAAAAYRAGVTLTDERAGRVHRYEARHGVIDTFLLLPAGAPASFTSREVLWNAAEAAENRKNSCVAREVILALPHELSDAGRASLAKDMALWLIERYGVAVDVALHAPVAKDGHDHRNHHAHVLFTTRALTPDGFAAKTRILDDKVTGKQETETLRLVWESLANDALARAGFADIRIDRRSLAEQGVERIPQTHTGRVAEYARDDIAQGHDYQDNTPNHDPVHEFMADRGERTLGKGESALVVSGLWDDPVLPSGEEGMGADSQEDDAINDEEEDDEEGTGSASGDSKGKQGSRGGGSGGRALKPGTAAKPASGLSVAESAERLEEVRQATDRGTRANFRAEIEALNEVRAAYGDKPLREQIADIERLIEKVEHRVQQLEILERKTTLPAVLRHAILEVVRMASDLLFRRQEGQGLMALTTEERLARASRQQARYGRIYRSGVHEQIGEMKTLIFILDARQAEYLRYERFVRAIEAAVLNRPSMASRQLVGAGMARGITTAESTLKLQLKAMMVRETIPADYQHPAFKNSVQTQKNTPANVSENTIHKSNTARIETTINNINNNILHDKYRLRYQMNIAAQPVKSLESLTGLFRDQAPSAKAVMIDQHPAWKQPIRGFDPLASQVKAGASSSSLKELARRERWFIPAGENTRSLENTIRYDLERMRENGTIRKINPTQDDSLRTRFAGYDMRHNSGKITSNQEVIERLKERAVEVRERVPTAYRKPAYEVVQDALADYAPDKTKPEEALSSPRMTSAFNRAAGQGAEDMPDQNMRTPWGWEPMI